MTRTSMSFRVTTVIMRPFVFAAAMIALCSLARAEDARRGDVALIMSNGARMEGIEASLFFTFFGLDAITNKRLDKLKVATVGNP